MNFFVMTLLLLVLYPRGLRSEEIKYKMVTITDLYNFEETLHRKEVVTSKENGFSITILNDFPVLRVGMLQIDHPTDYFSMVDHKLQEIEPGAFDNQNIMEQICLAGNNLTVIRSGTFKSIYIISLLLFYNNITHIEENAITDMPNLSVVYLSKNKIVQFHDNFFVNTPKMWLFDMSYNKLTKLGANWFNFMRKGDSVLVRVAYNVIKEIDPKTFEGFDVFSSLALNHNNLTSIPEEVFTENVITVLHLENNQLETLPEAFYEQKNLTHVDIRDNPLKCDVQNLLKDFNEKLGFLTPEISVNNGLRASPAQSGGPQVAAKSRGVVFFDGNC